MSPSQQLTTEQAISQAEKAARQGNIALARQLYRAVLQHRPNQPVAIRGLRELQQGVPHHQSVPAQMANPSQNQINTLINLLVLDIIVMLVLILGMIWIKRSPLE